MFISNKCTNDLGKKTIPNLKTVGGVVQTKEVPFWQPPDCHFKTENLV